MADWYYAIAYDGKAEPFDTTLTRMEITKWVMENRPDIKFLPGPFSSRALAMAHASQTGHPIKHHPAISVEPSYPTRDESIAAFRNLEGRDPTEKELQTFMGIESVALMPGELPAYYTAPQSPTNPQAILHGEIIPTAEGVVIATPDGKYTGEVGIEEEEMTGPKGEPTHEMGKVITIDIVDSTSGEMDANERFKTTPEGMDEAEDLLESYGFDITLKPPT